MTDTGSQLTKQLHFSHGTDISSMCMRPLYSDNVPIAVVWCMFPESKTHMTNILMHDVDIGTGVWTGRT